MAVYKDTQRGTWYVKYSVPDAVTGKRKQALKRGFSTKRDALEYESRQRLVTDARSSVTFFELSGKYFDYRKQKPTTRDKQTVMLAKYVTFGDRQIVKLSKADLMDWYLELDKLDLKPSMKNLILTVVKSVFKYGADFFDLPNPASMLKRFKAPKAGFDVWTPEQFNQFIQCVHLTHYRNIFLFLYMTGARKAEAMALRYDDISGDRCHIRGTKTDSSDRWIVLPAPLQTVLAPILSGLDDCQPYVFGGEKTLPIATMQAVFTAAIKESGVPPIRIHDLRHSFASNAIACGCNIVAVSHYLGHSSINITLSVYAHLLKDTEADMTEKMNNLYHKRITA